MGRTRPARMSLTPGPELPAFLGLWPLPPSVLLLPQLCHLITLSSEPDSSCSLGQSPSSTGRSHTCKASDRNGTREVMCSGANLPVPQVCKTSKPDTCFPKEKDQEARHRCSIQKGRNQQEARRGRRSQGRPNFQQTNIIMCKDLGQILCRFQLQPQGKTAAPLGPQLHQAEKGLTCITHPSNDQGK